MGVGKIIALIFLFAYLKMNISQFYASLVYPYAFMSNTKQTWGVCWICKYT